MEYLDDDEKVDVTKYDQCPECGSYNLISDVSERNNPTVCQDCNYKSDGKDFHHDLESEIF